MEHERSWSVSGVCCVHGRCDCDTGFRTAISDHTASDSSQLQAALDSFGQSLLLMFIIYDPSTIKLAYTASRRAGRVT